jgi:hypothetical protein
LPPAYFRIQFSRLYDRKAPWLNSVQFHSTYIILHFFYFSSFPDKIHRLFSTFIPGSSVGHPPKRQKADRKPPDTVYQKNVYHSYSKNIAKKQTGTIPEPGKKNMPLRMPRHDTVIFTDFFIVRRFDSSGISEV